MNLGNELPIRSMLTATETLCILIHKKSVIKDMHQAYKKIDLKQTNYGVFLSGPSKTANIEQTLVIGAHGAKSLKIFLY